jgi:hypothetical protein
MFAFAESHSIVSAASDVSDKTIDPMARIAAVYFIGLRVVG